MRRLPLIFQQLFKVFHLINQAQESYKYILLSIMQQKQVVTESKDGEEVTLTFRKILLNKCQKEFERGKKEENQIHVEMEELLSQGLSVSTAVLEGIKPFLSVQCCLQIAYRSYL